MPSHSPQFCAISRHVAQILLNDLASRNPKYASEIHEIEKHDKILAFNELYSIYKTKSIPVPTESILENLNTIITKKEIFMQHMQSIRCCIILVQNILQVIEMLAI